MYKNLFFLLALWLVSCEKNIDFKLNDAADTLVVDAEIENGKAPVVYLTKSVSFYSQVDAQVLASLFVRDAEVYISNDSLTHRL